MQKFINITESYFSKESKNIWKVGAYYRLKEDKDTPRYYRYQGNLEFIQLPENPHHVRIYMFKEYKPGCMERISWIDIDQLGLIN